MYNYLKQKLELYAGAFIGSLACMHAVAKCLRGSCGSHGILCIPVNTSGHHCFL